MTAPSTDRQFVRYVRTDSVRRVYGRHGARLPGLMLDSYLPIEGVRALADEEEARGDQLYPQRPANVAAELRKLADNAEARPLSVYDRPLYTDQELELLRTAETRCKERSPLLADFASDLESLAGWPSVGRMRDVAAVLDDVELLVPGIAARLRPLVEHPEIGDDW